MKPGKKNEQNIHLFMSWFQVKRAALPATPQMIEHTLLKHRKNMVAPDRATGPYVVECLAAADPVLQRIRRKIEPDFNRFIESKASQSASFLSTRRRGGQAGELSRRLGDWSKRPVIWSAGEWLEPPIQPNGLPNYIEPVQVVDVTVDEIPNDLESVDGIDMPDVICREKWEEGHKPPFADWVFLDDQPKDLVRMDHKMMIGSANADFGVSVVRTDSIIGDRFRRRMDPSHDKNLYDPEIIRLGSRNERLSRSAVDEEVEFLRARVAFVLEPLKVRIVTAGPSAHYFMARMHQKVLHDYLRGMPCFRLIGRPATPTDIMSIQITDAQILQECKEDNISITDYDGSPYRGMDEYLKTPRFWYSADYQESTDLLSRTLSGIVLQTTMSDKWNIFRHVMSMNLKPHIVCYPKQETFRTADIGEQLANRWLNASKKLSGARRRYEALESLDTEEALAEMINDSRSKDRAYARYEAALADYNEVIRCADPRLLDKYQKDSSENIALWDETILSRIYGDDVGEILFGEGSDPYSVHNLCRIELVREEYVVHANEKGKRVETGGKFFLVLRRALPPAVQNNAQLMGSRLSFTILCLCNMSLYLAVRRRTDSELGIKWTAKRVRFWLDLVLINGDDLLTQFTDKEISWFNEIGTDIGLKMSVGKVYKHERYANINSTAFDCPIEGGHATEIPYLNTGLFFGQNKVLSRVGGIEDLNEQEKLNGEAPHIAVLDEVVSGSLPGRQSDILKAYLEIHKSALRRECRGRNLFVALSLGGWGCRPPVGWTFHITPTQQNEIARLYCASDLVVQRPYISRRVEAKAEDVDQRPWRAVENINEFRPRLRKCRGNVLPMPPVDPTIERLSSGNFVFRQ